MPQRSGASPRLSYQAPDCQNVFEESLNLLLSFDLADRPAIGERQRPQQQYRTDSGRGQDDDIRHAAINGTFSNRWKFKVISEASRDLWVAPN